MMVEVRDQLRPLTTEVGIEIVDVRIKRTDLLPEVSQQTFERMRAERLAEAAQLRARGTELAARIRAEADREAVVTVAEAQREAEILRGQGDAERSRIFAEAYQRNPDFFEFYRSMRAYEHGARRHRHDAGAVAGFGVLPLLPGRRGGERRRRRQPAGAPALTGSTAESATPPQPPPEAERGRRLEPSVAPARRAGKLRRPPRRNERGRRGDRADPRAGRSALRALSRPHEADGRAGAWRRRETRCGSSGVVSAALGVALVWLVRG